jgi:hypothetical protein
MAVVSVFSQGFSPDRLIMLGKIALSFPGATHLTRREFLVQSKWDKMEKTGIDGIYGG